MATITEDYCSYEVAKLLKGKGFDWECISYYVDDEPDDIKYSFCGETNSIWESRCCSAPTLQMAMKWLREVHNMYYEIQLLLGEKAEKYGGLQLGIYQLNSSEAYVWKDWIYADTYVELYENYIKSCLKHLI